MGALAIPNKELLQAISPIVLTYAQCSTTSLPHERARCERPSPTSSPLPLISFSSDGTYGIFAALVGVVPFSRRLDWLLYFGGEYLPRPSEARSSAPEWMTS